MIDIERKAIDYANSKGYFGESPSMLRSMSYICIIDGFIEGYKRALTDSREGIKSNPEDNRNTPEEFIDKLRKRQIEQNDLNNRIDEIKREYDNVTYYDDKLLLLGNMMSLLLESKDFINKNIKYGLVEKQ